MSFTLNLLDKNDIENMAIITGSLTVIGTIEAEDLYTIKLDTLRIRPWWMAVQFVKEATELHNEKEPKRNEDLNYLYRLVAGCTEDDSETVAHYIGVYMMYEQLYGEYNGDN